MKNVIQIAMLTVLATLFFNPIQASAQFFFLENRDIGKDVQDFELKMLNKEKVNLKEVLNEKKAIIFFWATWCPHCRETLKMLNQKKDEIKEKNIEIVLVNVGEKEEIVSEYFKRNEIEMDVFLDKESEVFYDYGMVGVPTFYFISEKGIVENVVHELPENLETGFSKP